MAVLKQVRWWALGVMLWPACAMAQGELQLHEQEIKAGLLYNFLKYTDWPADNTAGTGSFVVCIFGADPFGGALTPMAGRTVNQRPITLRQIHAARDAGNCHLIFINADEQNHWPELRNVLAAKHVLTVSDFDGFAAAGGMIEFGHQDNHISASLNIDASNAAGLRVEDRLLRLVTVVHPVSEGAQQ